MATPRPEPLLLHEHAMDNLRYMRRMMERAGSFTAVPGLGGVLMGLTALSAAWVAGRRPDSGCRLTTANSSSVSGPAFFRIGSGTASFPMSWRSPPIAS